MLHSLSDLAAESIETLSAEGVKVTPHDVLHIAALADLVMTPTLRLSLARGKPVPVGGVTLWPLTLAAAGWWNTIGERLISRTVKTWALAFAMAEGRRLLPYDMLTAYKEILIWGSKLRCRNKELVEAISLVQEQDAIIDTGEKGPKATPGEISLMLTAMTGVKPRVWEYLCSMSYTFALIDAIVDHNSADGTSTKHDPSVKALRALGLAMDRIRERHFREAGKANG